MILASQFGIILLAVGCGLGENCKPSSGGEGYCREKDDCLGSSGGSGCQGGLVCCENYKIGAEKCKDYGKYVFKEDFGEALTVRMMIQNVSQCGIEAVPLVVGGVKAKTKEFPHMVAIGYGKELKTALWLCGGSLISENFVLSAAHCSESPEGGPAKFARFGILSLKSGRDSNAQDAIISERLIHPKYKKPSRYYDIALFKLSDSIKVDGFARPACIHSTPNEFRYQKAVATGWGKQNYDDNVGSSDLMKVFLSIIDYGTCNGSYSADAGGPSLKRGIISSQLCAGELAGGKDTCQGDSGGPLQVVLEDPYCMYTIIGITSFGKFCGFKNSPAVYTRVSYFAPWIQSVVWP